MLVVVSMSPYIYNTVNMLSRWGEVTAYLIMPSHAITMLSLPYCSYCTFYYYIYLLLLFNYYYLYTSYHDVILMLHSLFILLFFLIYVWMAKRLIFCIMLCYATLTIILSSCTLILFSTTYYILFFPRGTLTARISLHKLGNPTRLLTADVDEL